MAEANTSATKRKRVDSNAPLPPRPLWLPYGDIILKVEGVDFRVNRDVLAKHSTVFADMFSVPQPTNPPSMDNVPTVELPGDSAKDWTLLLDLFYDPYKYGENMPLAMIQTMLRLAQKYDMAGVRKHAVALIHLEFPSTLSAYDKTIAGGRWVPTRLAPQAGLELELLIEVDTYEIRTSFPALALQCLKVNPLVLRRKDGSRIVASSRLRIKLAVAAQKIASHQHDTFGWLKFDDDSVIPDADCTDENCETMRPQMHLELIQGWAEQHYPLLALWDNGLLGATSLALHPPMTQIYTSPLPDVPICETSIFTHLFASQTPSKADIGGFPASAPAYIDAVSGTSLSRAQLRDLALRFAFGLRNHANTANSAKRGEVVLFHAPNALAWPVALCGSIAAGLRCTLANSAYTARELAHQYQDSGAKLLITTVEGIPVVRAMFAELGMDEKDAMRRVIVFGLRELRWASELGFTLRNDAGGWARFEELLGMGSLQVGQEEKFEGGESHETVYLCYSSGTTGKPKGVETSHRNLTAVLAMMRHLFPSLASGNNTVLGILPFYHIYGATLLLMNPFYLGWTVLIQSQFEPVQFCQAIEKYRVALAFIVPPVLVVLARHPIVDKHDLSSLEYLLSAAAPLGGELVKQVKTRLLAKRKPGSRCLITQGYGLTETTTGVYCLTFADSARKVGSVGTLIPNLQARIVDDEDGLVDALPGAPGELWVKGPNVMKGYLGNVTATKETITPDGWFKTGDVVVQDKDGFVWVVDRRKELIKYKGFQVPPAELEALLLTHPDIADAAVIGVESAEQATELPRAYVVHARPQELQKQDEPGFGRSVAKWLESRVAKHKYLRGGVVVVDVVPKSAAGKILRRELRDRAKAELAVGGRAKL
ncbi:4-coumarate--CoA ligase-like 7 [Mycena indigotica]|uniref:4-coumarate--CoA ligase-like 7 n=1 Tax=Mycena indigotica TaxID=2126181 RepID=A0A8H6THZ5_9AGAR|nr:4-coumarate--CoA ligase-like 7 [Mycena indigotica]KAF7316075.1 4-coumarate--CoA ligase-like 7 [Mycena indigotica]